MKSQKHALLLCCLMIVTWQPTFAAEVIDIKADALLERTAKKDSSIVVVDVRSAEEFAQGHVAGAVNIPVDQLTNRIGELMSAKNKDVVLYCRSGRRAGQAAETLKAHGFEKLLHLEGDIQKWNEENRPVEKLPPENQQK